MAKGLSETDASTIISTIGATNTVGMVRIYFIQRYILYNIKKIAINKWKVVQYLI